MLRVDNVSKTFGEVKALKNISFTISDGEFVFLTGPSGAGKSTLLKLILKEFLPDEGGIFIDEVDITKLPNKSVSSYRQKIGVVFQDFKLLTEKNLRENIEIALAVVNVPQSDWKSKTEEVFEMVGLTGKSEFFPSQISGGEIQRVSLARALVVDPKILLADEPTGNLDWKTAEGIMDLLEKIHKKGKTIIVATHHQLLVEKTKNRVLSLDEGKLVKDSKTGSSDDKDIKDRKQGSGNGKDKEEVVK